MIATTQYNDFKGTSAADISDDNSLSDFASDYGLDLDIYQPIGVKFYSHYNSLLSFAFLCKGKNDEKFYIARVSEELKFEDFFMMFKRLEFVLFEKYGSLPSKESEYETIHLE